MNYFKQVDVQQDLSKYCWGDQLDLLQSICNDQPFSVSNTGRKINLSTLTQYCLGDQNKTLIHEPLIEDIGAISSIPNDHKMIKKQASLHHYDFSAKADALINKLRMIKDSQKVLIKAKVKAVSKPGPMSRTRSTFIGVTRASKYWQALISIGKQKTYIGCYVSERDAAGAFDFYCILLHSLKAKTNFTYTKEDLLSMLISYREHENTFNPATIPRH